MVKQVKENYVGFKDKVNKSNRKQFEVFTDSLKKIAYKTKESKCISLCKEWLGFFKDKHMTIAFNSNQPKDSVINFFSMEEKANWSETKLISYLANEKTKPDPVEGIWNNSTNTNKFGVVRDSLNKNEFIGFMIKADGVFWIPQQIKFRLKKENGTYQFVSFFARDHSDYPARISINRDTMDLKEIGKFYRNFLPKQDLSSNQYKPKFKKLDDHTSVLVIPSFAIELKKETDDLMSINDSTIKNTNHLIIDLRNNSGGAADAFEKILPYLYTDPILTEGAQVLATDDNIKDGYERIFNLVSGNIKESYRKKVLELKAHRNQLYLLYPIDTIKFNTILNNPSRISILMNNESASSAELFLLQARQSTKVKLFGTNSSGSINYLERVETQMPCKFFTLVYPPARLLRADKKMANVGIEPDVEIPENVKDWMLFVKEYKL
ncbi:S41 family peptidase [Pedobacter sp. N23S346]|uniref:S41 family peptidase n=1 Tax=Pedobacter sp. N23S346 TaxID=3402750 RepID=UPI003AD424E7